MKDFNAAAGMSAEEVAVRIVEAAGRIGADQSNQEEAYFDEENNAKSYVVECGQAFNGAGADLCVGGLRRA